MKGSTIIGVLVIIGLFVAIVAGNVASNNAAPVAKQDADCLVMGTPAVGALAGCKVINPNHTCKDFWRVCIDARDLANNNEQRRHAKAACQSAADDRARYGTPKWSWWGSFGSFYPDEDISNGTVTLVDTQAQFQNGFGAWAHVTVECLYDLKAEKVINVNIEER